MSKENHSSLNPSFLSNRSSTPKHRFNGSAPPKPFNSTMSSLNLPPQRPFKDPASHSLRGTSKSGSASLSEVAALKRQISTLSKQLQNLQRQHERLNDKHSSSLQDFKKARQAHESDRDEIGRLQKFLEKSIAEKEGLENVVTQNKEYIRKLERTVTKGTAGNALAETNLSLSYQNDKLRDELELLKSRYNKLEEKEREQELEVNILTEALDVKAQEMGLQKSADIRCSLLYDAGKSREELRKEREAGERANLLIKKLEVALEREERKSQELLLIRESNNQAFFEVEKELLESKKNEQVMRDKFEASEAERTTLLDYVEQVQKQQEEEAKEKEAEIAELNKQVKALESRNVEYSKKLAERELMIKELREEVSTLEEHNTKIARHFEKKKELIAILEEENEKLKKEKEDWEDRAQEFKKEVDAIKKKEASRHKEHDRASESLSQAKKELERVISRNKALEYTIKVTAEAQQKSEHALKEKMERTAQELHLATKERNILKEQMAEALRSAELLKHDQAQLKRENERCREQLGSMVHSKTAMQQTLNEQLQTMEQGRFRSREMVSHSKEEKKQKSMENEALQDKIRTTEQKNRELLEEVRKLRCYHNTMNSTHR